MACQRCGGSRVMRVSAKCSDSFYGEMSGADDDGYVPWDIGIGGGDYIKFSHCLDCGQLQGEWPLPPCDMEIESESETREDA